MTWPPLPVLCTALACLLLAPLPGAVRIKHSPRLDMRLWRLLSHKPLAGHRPAEGSGDVTGAFESDMRLTSEQLRDVLRQQSPDYRKTNTSQVLEDLSPAVSGSRRKRKAVAHTSYLWPGRVVPYRFQPGFPESFRQTVLRAMRFWQDSTCIRFVPHSRSVSQYLRHTDHVLFAVGTGCQSSVGRVGSGQQTTDIAPQCNEFGSVAHELGHVMGFYHEHSRPDRDQYVTILRHNIRSGRDHNFWKYSTNEILTNEPYDIGSVMHYGPTYFSKDRRSLTIDTADESFRAVMGQRSAPSFVDIKSANDLYTCNARCQKRRRCLNMGFQGPDCRCLCPTGLTGHNCSRVKMSPRGCGGVLTASSGVIQSPGFGHAYDNNLDCYWLIQARGGFTTMAVTAEWFEVEDDVIQPCAFDWLEVRTQGPHLTGQRFCGHGPSQTIVYHGKALVLHLHTDDSFAFRGFRLHYTIRDSTNHG